MIDGARCWAPLLTCTTPVRAVLGKAIGGTDDDTTVYNKSVDRGGSRAVIGVPAPKRRVVIARIGFAPAT